MVRRLLLGLLLLAGTSVHTSPAAAETPKIVHGSNEAGYPAVGWLRTNAGFCTATLIGCQTVLTAAHCICTNNAGEELPPAQCASAGLMNPAGKSVFFHHAGGFNVSSVAVHPQRNPGDDVSDPLHDLAVLRLATPVTGIAPAVINQSGAVANGASGVIVGFGVTNGFADDLGVKRSGAITTGNCDVIPGHLCWQFDGAQSNTCGGDSGGPLFVTTAQGQRLAGVTSFGFQTSCLATDFSYDADVYSDRAWIASAAGGDLATGTQQCGSLPNAGSANTSIVGRVDQVSTQTTTSPVVVPAGTAQLRVGSSGTTALQTTLTGPNGTVSCGSGLAAYCQVANPAAGSYTVTVRNLGGGTGEIQTVFTVLGAAAGTGDPDPPAGAWLTTSQLPGYRFKVRINGAAAGTQVTDCVPETLCVAGALPTRTELFLRVIGPRPNGFLWTQVVRFSTSRLEVWVERTATSEVRYYDLPAISAESDVLPGLVDKTAFAP